MKVAGMRIHMHSEENLFGRSWIEAIKALQGFLPVRVSEGCGSRD